MVRIVHASDLHLDASSAFLTGKKLTQRREDFLNSLDTVLNCCVDEKADILLIAGDFYDKVNPTNDDRYLPLNSLCKFTKKHDT